MIAIGLGAAWVSYTVGLYGYCLVRGYNVRLRDLLGTTWPNSYGGGTIGTPSPAAAAAPPDFNSNTFT